MVLRRRGRNEDHNPAKRFFDKYFLPLKRLRIVSKNRCPTEHGSVYTKGCDPWVDTHRVFGTTRAKAEKARRRKFPEPTVAQDESFVHVASPSLVPESQQRRSMTRSRTPRRLSAAQESTLQQEGFVFQQYPPRQRQSGSLESTLQDQRFGFQECTPRQRRSAAREPMSQRQSAAREPMPQRRSTAREPVSQQRSPARAPMPQRRSVAREPMAQQRQRSATQEYTLQHRRSATRESALGLRQLVAPEPMSQQQDSAIREPMMEQQRSTTVESMSEQQRSASLEPMSQQRRCATRDPMPQQQRSTARESALEQRQFAAQECTPEQRRTNAWACTPQRRQSATATWCNAPIRTPSPRAGHPLRDKSPLSTQCIRSRAPTAISVRTPCTTRSRDLWQPRSAAKEQFQTPVGDRRQQASACASPIVGRALMSAGSASRPMRTRSPPLRDDAALPKTPPSKRRKSTPPAAPRHKALRNTMGMEVDTPEALIAFFDALEFTLHQADGARFYRDIRQDVSKLAGMDFNVSYLAHLLCVARDCIRAEWDVYKRTDACELKLRVKPLHACALDPGTHRKERRAHVLSVLRTYDWTTASLPPKPDISKKNKRVCDLDLATNNPVVGPPTPVPRGRESLNSVLTPFSNSKRRLSLVKENAKKAQELEANKRKKQELRELHHDIDLRLELVRSIHNLMESSKRRCRNWPINFDNLVNLLREAQHRRQKASEIATTLNALIDAYPKWISYDEISHGLTKEKLIRYPRKIHAHQVLDWLEAERERLPPLPE